MHDDRPACCCTCHRLASTTSAPQLSASLQSAQCWATWWLHRPRRRSSHHSACSSTSSAATCGSQTTQGNHSRVTAGSSSRIGRHRPASQMPFTGTPHLGLNHAHVVTVHPGAYLSVADGFPLFSIRCMVSSVLCSHAALLQGTRGAALMSARAAAQPPVHSVPEER